jgi:hypothetical protein
MAKVVVKDIALDSEVAELVRRIGALDNPLNHIVQYDVQRTVDKTTLVTISFIADEHFSKKEEQ